MEESDALLMAGTSLQVHHCCQGSISQLVAHLMTDAGVASSNFKGHFSPSTEGQLSATGESMCKSTDSLLKGLKLPRKCVNT